MNQSSKIYFTSEKDSIVQSIIDEIDYRFDNSKYDVLFGDCEVNGKNGIVAYSIVRVKKGKVKVGIAYYNPKDEYYNDQFGEALSICRACGWKDLEKELLSIL